MSKTKKTKTKLTEKAKNVIRLDQYRKQVDALKAESKDTYKPKIGRQIHALEKKIQQAS